MNAPDARDIQGSPGASPDRERMVEAVAAAVAAVTDPEYPDVTIAELGMLEGVHLLEAPEEPGDAVAVRVDLIPTVFGCPALRTIESDVRAAALLAGATAVDVRFLHQPVWTPERIAATARQRLASEYTITLRGRDGELRCPLCGSAEVEERSAIGPARCRSVHYCRACRNPLEVLRA